MVDLVVQTTHGKVRGERRGAVAIWKGIPYAAPPVGTRRFRPPEPAEPWTGERDATRYAPVAIQTRSARIAMLSGVPEKFPTSEDCLAVNVFAPAEASAACPVMVWIHGGAFVMGSGSSPLYNGASFAERGVVVVTVNYRLGIAGFLYLGDLAPGYEAGNCALLDQVAALAWVRDNIAAFGGDPGQVTVMGESAGAMSVANLLTMPAARGLFHRAILESGAGTLSTPSRADATAATREILADLGTTVDLLAELPADRLIEAQEERGKKYGTASFGPYIDGATVPKPPLLAIADGAAAGIPILLGSNRDEWTLFEVFLGDEAVETVKAPLRERMGPLLDQLVETYRDDYPDRSLSRAWVQLIGELVFRIPAIRFAEAQSSHATPVYMYRFDWASPQFGGRLGATHALELPFVWNRLDLPTTPILLGPDLAAVQPLATAMHETWTAFIKTGEPNGGGLPAWPRYDATRRQTMLIDRQSRVVEDPAGAARQRWAAIAVR